MAHQSSQTASRRYNQEVKELTALLNEYGIKLKSFEEATNTDICIISTNDYDVAEPKEKCDITAKSYFVTEAEYDKYIDIQYGD